jgi:hypothetical protein
VAEAGAVVDWPEAPKRKREAAEQADGEILRVLSEMIDARESITFRSVVVRMASLSHTTDVTRDDWRRACVERAQQEQTRIRSAIERMDNLSRNKLMQEINRLQAKVKELESDRTLMVGMVYSLVRAIGELGGMRAWLKFFEHYQAALDRMRQLGAIPTADVLRLPIHPAGDDDTAHGGGVVAKPGTQ